MKLNLQGIEVKAARVLVGMKGHRASGFNRCGGGHLKGNKYSNPPVGMGGRHNKEVRPAFTSAVNSCK